MDQYIGQYLDNRYEILEQIGSGGMAYVYKARDHRLNRLVAVKILKSDLAEDAEFRRRFRDEPQAVAQLSHANIVSVYDVSHSGDTEYIVMELIDGITLKQYMERRGKMNWREALHFITQIMRGLSHAHSRGIIHRDIKPQNIMVLRDGSVKVADFGIACLANASQTLTQEALGSVHYISPEQARGDRTDARSDIYSAGVVLYEMLTSRLPFEGDSAVSVAIQHLSSIPLNPRDIDPDIPEGLELITMKAMNPNLEKRYGSADEMLDDLERFRRDPNVDFGDIRESLAVPVDDEPTQHIATADVKSAVRAKKAADQAAAKEAAEAKEAALEEGDRKKEKKRMALLIGGFTGALILVFIIFKLIIGGFGGEETSYEVPNLLGKTYEEAMAMEEVKDIFEIKIEGSRVDENYEPGQIIEQDPAAGHTRKKNLVIKVWLCAEEEKDIMPDLKGEDLDSAKRTLKNLGLSLEIKEDAQFSDDYDAGKVMSTSPAAGEEIKKGDTVTLVYSKGPEEVPVNVPSFLGMSFETAKSQAQSLGLTVNEAKYEYSNQPEGNVIDQSLSNGDTVKKGTSITFTVSKGKEPPKTVSKDVSFAVPYFADDYTGSVEVSFIQDGSEIGHQNARCGDTVSCTVVGTSGTSSTVEAYFTPENDPETGEPAYDTKSASTTVYFE